MSTAQAQDSSDQLIRVTSKEEGDVIRFFVENLQLAEVTVTFEVELKNLESSTNFPHTATYPGLSKTEAFALTNAVTGKKWSWAYTYYATFGSTTAVHDDQYAYLLPYSPGQAFRVSQGYQGKYSHFGANEYAIDWKMPLGTPVHAAREGTVVAIKSDSDQGGPDSKYDRDANFILIQHPDGTLGHYVHLMKGGVRVKLGQKVNAGDWIGMSGNTGHSTGPHLHFSVFKAKDGKTRQTLPVKYRTADALAVMLERGRSYKAAGWPSSLAVVPSQAPQTAAVGGP